MVVCEEGSDRPAYIDGMRLDLTERRRSEEALEAASLVDKLTGLPNRAQLFDRPRQCLARRERRPGEAFAREQRERGDRAA